MNQHKEARLPAAKTQPKALRWIFPALLTGCVSAQAPSTSAKAAGEQEFRLKLCSERPLQLEGPPGAQQSRGCVVTFHQELTDEATRARLGVSQLKRRYLVYVPEDLVSAGLSSPPCPLCSCSQGQQPWYKPRTRLYANECTHQLAVRPPTVQRIRDPVAAGPRARTAGRDPQKSGQIIQATSCELGGMWADPLCSKRRLKRSRHTAQLELLLFIVDYPLRSSPQ